MIPRTYLLFFLPIFIFGFLAGMIFEESNLGPTTLALEQKLDSANGSMKACADALREKSAGFSVLNSPSGAWQIPGRVEPRALNDPDGVWTYVDEQGATSPMAVETVRVQ